MNRHSAASLLASNFFFVFSSFELSIFPNLSSRPRLRRPSRRHEGAWGLPRLVVHTPRSPTRRRAQISDKIADKVAKGEVRAAPRRRGRPAGALLTTHPQTFFSFEFFPPKTEDGLESLWEKMDTMVALQARPDRQQPLLAPQNGGAVSHAPPALAPSPGPPRLRHRRGLTERATGRAFREAARRRQSVLCV